MGSASFRGALASEAVSDSVLSLDLGDEDGTGAEREHFLD
jgi:hypothetical protein